VILKLSRKLSSVTAELGQWRKSVPYQDLNFAYQTLELSAMVSDTHCYDINWQIAEWIWSWKKNNKKYTVRRQQIT